MEGTVLCANRNITLLGYRIAFPELGPGSTTFYGFINTTFFFFFFKKITFFDVGAMDTAYNISLFVFC